MARPPLALGTAGKIRYIKSSAGWTARCGFRDFDGVTRDIDRSGATKAAAERTLKAALRDRGHHDRGAAINPDTKLSAVAEAWWQTFVAQDGSLGSKGIYRQQLDNHILPSVGNIRCRELSVGVAERFLRLVEEKHGKSLAKTIRTVLSNICAFAARMDAMDRNPVRDTSPINAKPKKGEPRALGIAELRQLRAYATYHLRAVRRDTPGLIDFMAATGKRVGECLAVTEDALDVVNRTVEVRGTVVRLPGVGVAISRAPKSEAGLRTLTLPEWVMPSVESRVAKAVRIATRVVQVNEHTELVIPPTVFAGGRRRSLPPTWLAKLLEDGKEKIEEIAIIFPSSAGTLRDPSNAAHDVKEVFVFAGLPDDSSHLIRKSVATQMDDAGVPVRAIADQLGHARPSMTQDVYFGRNRLSTRGAPALESLGF